jgi:hypothetical protein
MAIIFTLSIAITEVMPWQALRKQIVDEGETARFALQRRPILNTVLEDDEESGDLQL